MEKLCSIKERYVLKMPFFERQKNVFIFIGTIKISGSRDVSIFILTK